MERQKQAAKDRIVGVKEKVMGSASHTGGSMSDSASGAVHGISDSASGAVQTAATTRPG